MKQEHEELMLLISRYLEQNPELRFGQALFNLSINEFANPTEPEREKYRLRDIYGDSDRAILERARAQLARLGGEGA